MFLLDLLRRIITQNVMFKNRVLHLYFGTIEKALSGKIFNVWFQITQTQGPNTTEIQIAESEFCYFLIYLNDLRIHTLFNNSHCILPFHKSNSCSNDILNLIYFSLKFIYNSYENFYIFLIFSKFVILMKIRIFVIYYIILISEIFHLYHCITFVSNKTYF